MWIEIYQENRGKHPLVVTPFAGVWIEIAVRITVFSVYVVTPFAGVWIEIKLLCNNSDR